MRQVSFDTYAAARKLEQAGHSGRQAEVVVEVVSEATRFHMRLAQDVERIRLQVDNHMATKADYSEHGYEGPHREYGHQGRYSEHGHEGRYRRNSRRNCKDKGSSSGGPEAGGSCDTPAMAGERRFAIALFGRVCPDGTHERTPCCGFSPARCSHRADDDCGGVGSPGLPRPAKQHLTASTQVPRPEGAASRALLRITSAITKCARRSNNARERRKSVNVRKNTPVAEPNTFDLRLTTALGIR